MEKDTGREDVIGFDALYRSMWKCKRGVAWKDSVAAFTLRGVEKTERLSRDLRAGTYKAAPPKHFQITHPKPRSIASVAFRDRVYQRSLNDNVVYPEMVRGFIFDNYACQKGKGTKFCIDVFLAQLREFTRIHGNNAHVLQCDIKGYFPNSNHDVVCSNTAQYVDPYTARACEDVIRSFTEIEFTKILMAQGMAKRDAHNAGHRISGYLIYGGDWKRVIKWLNSSQVTAVTKRIQQGDFKGVGLDIKKQDRICLVGFGAGLTYGGIRIPW